MLARIALVAAVAALFVVPAARTASTGAFFVGFTEDLPKEIGPAAVQPAAQLGAKAFRITLMWSPGQTQLASADRTKVDRAVKALKGMRFVLAVYADAGSKAPVDEAGRSAYCSYVKNVLARYASIRDVAVWNEPNKNFFWSPQQGAPAAYEALLERCWDVLHAAFPNVNVVGLLLSRSGNDNSVSTSPVQFIRGVGEAYRAGGRTKRILDTVGHHPYPLTNPERPWRRHIGNTHIAEGDWNKLMYNLWLAFDDTAQPIPGEGGVSIWYLEQGFQTAIDPAKASAYTGTENVAVIPADAGGEPDSPPPAETSPAPDQRTQFVDAVRLAYCQPFVGGFFNFLLADEPRLEGWQSGAYWADLTPKPSRAFFAQAIGEVNAGAVDCDALKGGRPSADFMPPSAPSGLSAAVRSDPLGIILAWTGSTDAAGEVSYRIARNGNLYATTSDTTWTDEAVVDGKTYSYVVRAVDSAGNLSDPAGPVTATPSATASATLAAPSSAPAGGTLDVSWSGVATPTTTDWIGLYRAGDADGAYVDWLYDSSCTKTAGAAARTSGSCSFTLPATAGTYELRLFASDGFTLLASSGTVTVTEPTLVAGAANVAPGGTLSVSWGGVATPTTTDWIGLYRPGDPSTAYLDWIYDSSCAKTAGSTPAASGSCSFTMPLVSGTYELRLLAADGYGLLATSEAVAVG